MSDLYAAAADYLTLRRSLGFALDRADGLLADFIDHLHSRHLTHITTHAAVEWATLPHDANPWWWRRRLTLVRGFARYLQATDPATEIPPPGLIHALPPRAVPYLFTDDDIAGLISAAQNLTPLLRARTYASLIGLLAVTGVRISEAINLDDTDVDLTDAVLLIRHTKFDKTRQLVIDQSTVQALCAYRDARCHEQRTPRASAFYVSTAGTRLRYSNVLSVFHRLTDQVGLQNKRHGRRPRMHDFRHGFAVQSVLDCYTGGLDAGPRLAALSTYLGHTKPADTYWYYSDSRVIPMPAASCA